MKSWVFFGGANLKVVAARGEGESSFARVPFPTRMASSVTAS